MIGIYEIVNLCDGKATAYIGSSIHIEQRWEQHRRRLRAGRHRNDHLQSAWDKYGEGAFWFAVIEKVSSQKQLTEREQYWLDRYLENPDGCYNIAITAEPGGQLAEETRRKLSEANKGQIPWMQGKHHSEEARRKMSGTKTGKNNPNWGKQRTKEIRRKISAALTGRKLSKEHRRSLSKGQRGRQHSQETRRRMSKAHARLYPAFVHRDTGEIILAGHNLKAMCKRHGFTYTKMCEVKSGRRIHHKGWMLKGDKNIKC